MKRNRKRFIIGSSVVLLIIILIVIGKSKNSGAIEVHTGEIETRTIISTVSANGTIKPEEEVRISPDVFGEIIELHVNEGDTVKQGELLVKLDPDLYVSALDRARANLSSSQSSYKTNEAMVKQAASRLKAEEASFQRNTKLYEEKVISQSEYDAATASYEVLKGDLEAAKERLTAAQFGIENARASMAEAQKNLERTRIYAPTDGVVSALNSEKGERVVGTGQMAGTEIMVISNLNNMEVIVDVNENDILQITKGDTAIIEVEAYRDRKFKGLVSEISKSANRSISAQAASEQVTNFEVKIRILKSSYEDLLEVTDAPFLTGMSATVEIQTETKRNIPCLPIEAVGTRQKKLAEDEEKVSGIEEELDEVVFSVKNGKAVKHIVTTGIQDNRYIEIVTGLDSINKVIVGPYQAVSKNLDDEKRIEVTKKKGFDKLE